MQDINLWLTSIKPTLIVTFTGLMLDIDPLKEEAMVGSYK